ncbi:unnamed protein product [Cuscuta europaea]|uniref:Peptide N-acetyl-beta-D-glucosaminyl asparaginase amidase A N-terminal domain-containing protein n=1 Tax=Cuscuta europaea TaxID=41803 RepID=A0A9P0ZR20_CUSEU|nr:unnamed protein product [Cuscuta europaea]
MTFFSLLFSALFLLLQPLYSAASLHSSAGLFRSQLIPENSLNDTLTTYFEVTKPINVPNTKPCSYLLLEHDFAYTYGKPPVLANYTPPLNCPSQNFSKIVLEWEARSKGRQFDRIFGVWLGGVEILRSCTAEPRATGIVWTVKKDITRYSPLLMGSDQILAVYMGNVVDDTYTGVYHVSIKIHFYPYEEKSSYYSGIASNGFSSIADLILPVSRNLPMNDGLWFEIQNSTDISSQQFKIPQNTYRAVLEVYVSFHENDEFWYGNPPNDYIAANNLSDALSGNGPFREVLVSLDGEVVGAVWPFTVIYTGGVNPLLWRPITAIGSFDLPSYDIEITPILGLILDGKSHKISFSVTNALNVWYIDANLHLWLDGNSQKTEGKLIEQKSFPLSFSQLSNFTGLNGSFLTESNRTIQLTGWVNSSHGVVHTKAVQDFKYSSFMIMGNKGNMQIVNQTINSHDAVYFKKSSSSIQSFESAKKFYVYMHSDEIDQGNKSYSSLANVTLGFNEKSIKSSGSRFSISSLRNLQKGQGSMLVKGNLVVSGLGSTQQAYHYHEDSFCYSRDIHSSNYTILHDKESYACEKGHSSHLPA